MTEERTRSLYRMIPGVFRRRHPRRFQGDWEARLSGIFDLGIDFTSRSLLDVGSNMGVVGYEVSKKGLAFYHGVEVSKLHVRTAKLIFLGVRTQSEIHQLDITNIKRMNRILKPSYDIVFFLAVRHHLAKAKGEAVADKVTRELLSRTNEQFLFRGPDTEKLLPLAEEMGFEAVATKAGSEINDLLLLRRT